MIFDWLWFFTRRLSNWNLYRFQFLRCSNFNCCCQRCCCCSCCCVSVLFVLALAFVERALSFQFHSSDCETGAKIKYKHKFRYSYVRSLPSLSHTTTLCLRPLSLSLCVARVVSAAADKRAFAKAFAQCSSRDDSSSGRGGGRGVETALNANIETMFVLLKFLEFATAPD